MNEESLAEKLRKAADELETTEAGFSAADTLCDLARDAAKELDSLPKINAKCVTPDRVGSMYLRVIEVQREDDNSFTAVLDHWCRHE